MDYVIESQRVMVFIPDVWWTAGIVTNYVTKLLFWSYS